jgi:hypothetical protein
MIRIGKKGRITKGTSAGWFVLVDDDSENTGGFLILTAKDIDFEDGFDNWVENMSSLEQYFQEAGWEIEWW